MRVGKVAFWGEGYPGAQLTKWVSRLDRNGCLKSAFWGEISITSGLVVGIIDYTRMMSKSTQRRNRRLATEQRRIKGRLEKAVAFNPEGPLLGRANISYELSERSRGISHGGMGMIAKVVKRSGLAEAIDSTVKLLKIHKPYHESDHW